LIADAEITRFVVNGIADPAHHPRAVVPLFFPRQADGRDRAGAYQKPHCLRLITGATIATNTIPLMFFFVVAVAFTATSPLRHDASTFPVSID
jgi:hypothetical protein